MQQSKQRRMDRPAMIGVLSALATTGTLLLLFALLFPSKMQAATPARPPAQAATTPVTDTVHIVVQFAERDIAVRTITLTEPISGLAALLRSGLDVTVADAGFGPAVCAVEGVGCPLEDCFCDPARYWGYANAGATGWQPYQVGASQSMITATGSVEGWRWGEGENPTVAAPQALAATRALDWLRNKQESATGGYGDGLSGAVEVMLALGSNHERIADWQAAGSSHTLADFVRLRATRHGRQGVAEAGKQAVANVAAGGCRTVRSLQPSAYYSDTIGAYASDSGFNAWGILGTLALSGTVPTNAVTALVEQQQPDGGWEWQTGFGTDSNTTALAVQTLVAAGSPVTATEIISGLAFLKRAQMADGGFAYDPAAPEFGADANSTAYALMALTATGKDAAGETWSVEGNTAVDFLLSLQLPDGSIEWQAGSGPNFLATAQAVTALLGEAYPLAVGELTACRR